MTEITESYSSKDEDEDSSDGENAQKLQSTSTGYQNIRLEQQVVSLSADSDDSDDPVPKERRFIENTAKQTEGATNEESDSGGPEEDVAEPVTDGNMRIVASHYNELKETGRKERLQSRIVYMRNFNNWLKSQLIAEYLARIKAQQRIGDPMRVLDLCCGKGGDLLKWEKANITHLICTDIAEVSVDQCKKRYEEMQSRADKSKFATKFSAEFFACDATLVRLRERYKDKSLKLNLVSCQFAFHYSFESLTQAECMVRNAAECLQPGGYFIATIPDANEIMRRLRQSPNPRSIGNDIYKIDFICDTDPPPLFGAKYQFHLEGVVDCPEFLVHFPTLVKLCRKHGLKLERKATFADYYKESLDKGRSLLQRMNGLETVIPNRRGKDPEFQHLQTYFKGGSSKSVGTLSQSEWEATTLYLLCAFRKCKNTWDNEGKPVFEFD
ncbi:mRNA cap guanine-N7 methyltransferase [Bactrocera neohumeralis]|uniref:mRNA cap guanine-N7 methyltransferase n=1 Tax=Bactrocera neohumeralis TaxID=98809 RepID=UPI001A98BA68|nr:mRNA cap guanine-N7 methyltransferase isoform X1 [Bactrocera tryoni]XP_050330817.1 mRNA cap guanine-N7 methyltransferase [Bactrocera neohumeralis]